MMVTTAVPPGAGRPRQRPILADERQSVRPNRSGIDDEGPEHRGVDGAEEGVAARRAGGERLREGARAGAGLAVCQARKAEAEVVGDALVFVDEDRGDLLAGAGMEFGNIEEQVM